MSYAFAILFKFLFLFVPAKKGVPESIYNFKVAAAKGGEIDLAAYKGKKILIVNAPWYNNNDRQYNELNELYKKYHDKLVVIGFLAEDFGIQPGSKKPPFTQKTYNVDFPIAAKVQIRGNDMAPIFKWLTDKQYNNYQNTEIKWNFQKYLVDEEGKLVAVFDPKVKAYDPKLIAAIEQ